MKEITVLAGIIIKDKKVLLARRGINESYSGWYEFPGGKLELNESKPEAIRREINEEFLVDCQVIKYLTSNSYRYEFALVHLDAYLVSLTIPNITLTVHDHYDYYDYLQAKELQLLVADIPIIDFLYNNNYIA